MRKFIQQKLKDQKGLTLIELLAVIVILAIIAAIAIPAIGNIIENSRVGAIKSDALNALAAADLYFVDENDVTVDEVLISELAVPATGSVTYLDDIGSLSSGANDVITRDGEITTTGTVGGVTITFDAATKSEVNELKNNAADGANIASGAVTVER